MRRAGEGVALRRRVVRGAAHRLAVVAALSGSPRRARTAAQIAAATSPSLGRASISAQRSGSASTIARKARLSVSWNARPSPSKRSAAALAAPRRGARQPFGGGQVEHQREVGPARADRDPLEAGDQRRIEPAGRALIGARRIEETVADDPVAALQRRRDRRVDMVDAGGAEQDRLADRAVARRAARQNDLAQRLGARRAARLAGQHDVAARPRRAARRDGAPGPTCPPPPRLRA